MSLPGAGAVANETNANRGRREERHDSCPAPSGPRALRQAGPLRGAARPKGRRAAAAGWMRVACVFLAGACEETGPEPRA